MAADDKHDMASAIAAAEHVERFLREGVNGMPVDIIDADAIALLIQHARGDVGRQVKTGGPRRRSDDHVEAVQTLVAAFVPADILPDVTAKWSGDAPAGIDLRAALIVLLPMDRVAQEIECIEIQPGMRCSMGEKGSVN